MNPFDQIRAALFTFMKEKNQVPEKIQIPKEWIDPILGSPLAASNVTIEPHKFGQVKGYCFTLMGYDTVRGDEFKLVGERPVTFK